jgi:hypothetical protein
MKLGRNLARTFLDYYKLQNHIVFNPSTSIIPKLNNSLVNYKNLPNTSLLTSTNTNNSSNANNNNNSSISSNINNNYANPSANGATSISSSLANLNSNNKMSTKRSPSNLTAHALKPLSSLGLNNPVSSSSLSNNSTTLAPQNEANVNSTSVNNLTPKSQAQSKFLVENSFE